MIPAMRTNPYRFSVRAIMMLVLVVAAGLGWLVRSAHIQRDAVAVIGPGPIGLLCAG